MMSERLRSCLMIFSSCVVSLMDSVSVICVVPFFIVRAETATMGTSSAANSVLRSASRPALS